MKLPVAVSSGAFGLSMFGGGVVNALPTDTGEWRAVLASATGAADAPAHYPQEMLVNRISFLSKREEITRRLHEVAGPALSELFAAAASLFGEELVETSSSCELNEQTSECFMHARIRIQPKEVSEATYVQYQQLLEVVTAARRQAGVSNLDVDVLVD